MYKYSWLISGKTWYWWLFIGMITSDVSSCEVEPMHCLLPWLVRGEWHDENYFWDQRTLKVPYVKIIGKKRCLWIWASGWIFDHPLLLTSVKYKIFTGLQFCLIHVCYELAWLFRGRRRAGCCINIWIYITQD